MLSHLLLFYGVFTLPNSTLNTNPLPSVPGDVYSCLRDVEVAEEQTITAVDVTNLSGEQLVNRLLIQPEGRYQYIFMSRSLVFNI